jgi:hypothetical protein
MGSSPGWLKRALVLFFFGVKAIIFGMVAENKLVRTLINLDPTVDRRLN